MYVLDDVSLTNFKALKGTPTLYNSGQVSKGDFQVTFTNAGTYHIVVDNMFNRISGKSVTVYATLEWETPV